MKPLADESIDAPSQDFAVLVIDTLPLIMRSFGAEMRQQHPHELTPPQFRTLMYLKHHEGVSLTVLAEHMHLTPPTASKLVEGLVKRQYLTRVMAEQDRRRAIITLTPEGATALERLHQLAIIHMRHALQDLTDEEKDVIVAAMRIFRRTFDLGRTNICCCPPARHDEEGRE